MINQPSASNLLNETNYLDYITNSHPIMTEYVHAFLHAGFTYKIAHTCLNNMYALDNSCNVNNLYKSPSDTVITKLNDLFFDETVIINDNSISKYYGNGTYYLNDTGSITKLLNDQTFKEFLEGIGIHCDEISHICEDYPNIIPEEYIVCLFHYVHNTLFPLTLPEFDADNIIRWGRKNLRNFNGIDSYLLNYSSLQEYILTENNEEYAKMIINFLLEEFPHSQTVLSLKSLLETGKICDIENSKVYDALDKTRIEKCRKFMGDSIIVAKRPKNLKINGSNMECGIDNISGN